MAIQVLQVVVERIPLLATVVVISLLAVLVKGYHLEAALSAFPIAGEAFGNAEKRRKAYKTEAKKIYTEGYERFKNKVFRITSPHSNNVVLPTSFLPELSNLPDDVISVVKALDEQLQTKYTDIDTTGAQPIVVHTLRTTLTPSLSRLNRTMVDEVDRTLRAEMPPCKDWTEVNNNAKLLRIVARVSGRIFVGPELCHDESYIKAAVHYTIDFMQARQAIHDTHPWLRWLMASSLPEVKKLKEHDKGLMKILNPLVTARREAERKDPGYEKPDDLLQWVMDNETYGVKSDRELAKIQQIVGFAAIHTTTLTVTNTFYNLAVHPELVQELREEIQSVLAEHNNTFSNASLQKMKKLDSVLKESMRLHPLGLGFFRKVLKPFTLSNGQRIPAGVMIEVPGYHVAHDPSIFSNPETFDGLRFYRMREQGETFNIPKNASTIGRKATNVEADAHNLFVSVSPNSLLFGYGRHACPGRFFAANEIKIILARALLMYDFKNVGEGVEARERYAQISIGDSLIPDPTKTLLFKAV